MSTLYRRKYGCSRTTSSMRWRSLLALRMAEIPGSRSSLDDSDTAGVALLRSRRCWLILPGSPAVAHPDQFRAVGARPSDALVNCRRRPPAAAAVPGSTMRMSATASLRVVVVVNCRIENPRTHGASARERDTSLVSATAILVMLASRFIVEQARSSRKARLPATASLSSRCADWRRRRQPSPNVRAWP